MCYVVSLGINELVTWNTGSELGFGVWRLGIRIVDTNDDIYRSDSTKSTHHITYSP
jgi:hypothetical protein